jgi:hypothetical protein
VNNNAVYYRGFKSEKLPLFHFFQNFRYIVERNELAANVTGNLHPLVYKVDSYLYAKQLWNQQDGR